MPAPLWEDAKNWLMQQGVDLSGPDAHVILNDTMNKMAQGLVTRPSYGGQYGAPVGGGSNDVLSPQMQSSIQQTPLAPPIPSPAPVTKGSAEGYSIFPKGSTGVVPRNPVRPSPSVVSENASMDRRAASGASQLGQQYAKELAGRPSVSKSPLGAPGSEPDFPGGAEHAPGQAQAAVGSAPQLPGSGSDNNGLIGNIMDWISQNGAKVAAGLGMAGGVVGSARMLRPGAAPGTRPRGAPGLGIGEGITPPGGGPGSGFAGSMSGGPVTPSGPTITPSAIPPGIGANPLTGTLPLGGGPSVTMPLPPPTVGLSTHGNVPMGAYGSVAQTGVIPSGPPTSVPPGVINQGGPDIAALLSAPPSPTGGGRIRSPRPRTPPAPKGKPAPRSRNTGGRDIEGTHIPNRPKVADAANDIGERMRRVSEKLRNRNKGGKTAADADQNDARIKRNRAAQNRSR